MQAIRTYFDLQPTAEITIEMNPETVTAQSLEAYLEMGINRFQWAFKALMTRC